MRSEVQPDSIPCHLLAPQAALATGWLRDLAAPMPAGLRFERLARGTQESAAAFQALLEARRQADAPKKRIPTRKIRMLAGIAMIEAGWVEPGHSWSWEMALLSEDLPLIEAGLKAGMAPWNPKSSFWSNTLMGQAIRRAGRPAMLALARAMPPPPMVEAASKRAGSLMFDVVDRWAALDARAREGLWAAWKEAGLDIDARERGEPGAQTALMHACAKPAESELAVRFLLSQGAVVGLSRWHAKPRCRRASAPLIPDPLPRAAPMLAFF